MPKQILLTPYTPIADEATSFMNILSTDVNGNIIVITTGGTTNVFTPFVATDIKSGSEPFNTFALVEGAYQLAVTFEAPYDDTNYAINLSYSTDNNENVFINYKLKTNIGFTIMVSGELDTSGTMPYVDWITTSF
jgi:hypothetical protein